MKQRAEGDLAAFVRTQVEEHGELVEAKARSAIELGAEPLSDPIVR
jgi:hypothetical protein